MSLLIATVHRKEQLHTIKIFLQVYFTILEQKFQESADLTVLAYYCLFGVSKQTDTLIKAEFSRQGKDPDKLAHAVHQSRYRLKRIGALIKHTYTLDLSLHPDLIRTFSDTDKLGYMLNFTYDFAEHESVEENPNSAS